MSNFSGVTFPFQAVTPSDDAIIRRRILADSILSGCEFSYSGSTLTMAAGQLIACGRQFRHSLSENWAVTGATSGFARLLLTIDTTKASTKTAFDQINTAIEYATAANGFPALTQADINEAGTIYQVVLCVVSLGAGGITGIISQLIKNPSPEGAIPVVLVSLPASGWSGNRQTVSVPGVFADEDVCHPEPVPVSASHSVYYDCDVHGIEQQEGKLTFECEEVPTKDLSVMVKILYGRMIKA